MTQNFGKQPPKDTFVKLHLKLISIYIWWRTSDFGFLIRWLLHHFHLQGFWLPFFADCSDKLSENAISILLACSICVHTCACVYAELGLFHSIGRTNLQSNVKKFRNYTVLNCLILEYNILTQSICMPVCFFFIFVHA